MKKVMTPERWTSIFCLLVAAFFIITMPSQTSSRPIPGARGFDILNGAFFPKIAVTLFIIAAVGLFLEGRPRSAAADKDANAHASSSTSGDDSSQAAGDGAEGLTGKQFLMAVGLMLSVLLYIQALSHLGYVLSTIIGVAILSYALGQRSWIGLALGAVAFPIVVWYVFYGFFRVPLPIGEWWL